MFDRSAVIGLWCIKYAIYGLWLSKGGHDPKIVNF